MSSYQNQCRRGPGRGDCSVPEMAREKEYCRMPEMAKEKECFRIPENERRKEECHMHDNSEWPIGMTYVPLQEWRKIYQPDEGFHKGTIFAELDLPFLGRRMC